MTVPEKKPVSETDGDLDFDLENIFDWLGQVFGANNGTFIPPQRPQNPADPELYQ